MRNLPISVRWHWLLLELRFKRAIDLTKYVALFVLCFSSSALTQHVPDLSPHAVGLMADVLIDEQLDMCRDHRRPDWLTAEDCERLRNERERRRQTRNSSPPRQTPQ